MPDLPKSVIVGTAGHIDHGKSALVEALTGTHPDRLEEEKRRGITIDLGFAFLVHEGIRFGFVDVPGHERFVSNMLAGATGIDLVMLVVAADESIKPQTREHFDICRLLGVQRGIVALTKSDLVDADTLTLVRLELDDYLRGSFLEGAPIVPVSAKTGAGLPVLKEALRVAADEVRGKDASGYFRLPIDRAFSVKGFGTVVTGTLVSGGVSIGDEVELFPGNRGLRVRGVQSAGETIDRGMAGQRTAVNLAGIEHTALHRGMVLASPGRFRATHRIDAHLQLLPSAPKMKQRARVHFHCGTASTVAEMFLFGQTELLPGRQAFAQFRLQEPILTLPGDRLVIRQFSPVITIGGGMVLDSVPRRPMLRDSGRVVFLEELASGDQERILSAIVGRAPFGLSLPQIVERTGWLEKRVHDALNRLAQHGTVRKVSSEPLVVVAPKVFEDAVQKIAARVERFHKENPLLPGISREDLRSALGRRVRPETFQDALNELVSHRKLDLQGDVIKRSGAAIILAPEETAAKEQIETAFASTGLAVPTVKEVLSKLPVEAKRAEKILQILLREKILIRVTVDLVFHRDALSDLRQSLAVFKKNKGERISVPAFKDLTGITRKYAIPLLEYLDRERVTRRAGDERVIL
jgi:selenocysteine-specific elongation factor